MDGKCNCGAIKVQVEDPELYTKPRGHICYCYNCQKTSGSNSATNLIISKNAVTLTGAENLALYEDKGSLSGNPVRRYFCKTCGNPIKSEVERADKMNMVILKLGIFSDTKGGLPTPEVECFVSRKQKWANHVDGTKRYETVMGGKEVEEFFDRMKSEPAS